MPSLPPSTPMPSNPGQEPIRGKVYLVGAGPGDPELLTLRGWNVLQQAQVILPDALLSSTFQAHYPAAAHVIPVGKRCGKASSTPQEAIHTLMIQFAKAGLTVVRLKGGDPLVFGRGAEEALALQEVGIPFEIIPGVSAAQAAAAAAGVPLSHRNVSRSLTFLEGHHPDVARDAIPLLNAGGTLALYMGTRSLARIASTFLEAGLQPNLPVVLVEGASLPEQVLTRSTLAHAARGTLLPTTESPGLVLFGKALLHRFSSPCLETSHVPAPLDAQPAGQNRPVGGRRFHRAG